MEGRINARNILQLLQQEDPVGARYSREGGSGARSAYKTHDEPRHPRKGPGESLRYTPYSPAWRAGRPQLRTTEPPRVNVPKAKALLSTCSVRPPPPTATATGASRRKSAGDQGNATPTRATCSRTSWEADIGRHRLAHLRKAKWPTCSRRSTWESCILAARRHATATRGQTWLLDYGPTRARKATLRAFARRVR